MKKIICIMLSIAMLAVFAGCSKVDDDITTEAEIKNTAETTTQTETTTQAETTTQPETTTVEETTKPDGSSIQEIVDTLESKKFYMAGTINLLGGESMDAKATCEGDNSRIDISSAQMKISLIYLDNTPYLVNTSSNTYAVLDQAAFDSMDQFLSSMSGYGVNFSGGEINEMKDMMSNFDSTMDYSQYIQDGEYSEYNVTNNGVEYLVSEYATEYGKIRIYTLDGALKTIDVFDADGLRQMNFEVSAFIPQVLTPVTLTGLTKTNSILNLFTGK